MCKQCIARQACKAHNASMSHTSVAVLKSTTSVQRTLVAPIKKQTVTSKDSSLSLGTRASTDVSKHSLWAYRSTYRRQIRLHNASVWTWPWGTRSYSPTAPARNNYGTLPTHDPALHRPLCCALCVAPSGSAPASPCALPS